MVRGMKAWRGGDGPVYPGHLWLLSISIPLLYRYHREVTSPPVVTPRIRFSILAVGNKLGQLQLWRHTLPSEYLPCGAAGGSNGEAEEEVGGSTAESGTVLPGLLYTGSLQVHDAFGGWTGGAPVSGGGGGSGASGSGGGGSGAGSFVVASCWTLVPGPGRGGSSSGSGADGSGGGGGSGTSSAPPPRRWVLVEPRVGEAGDTLLLATGEQGEGEPTHGGAAPIQPRGRGTLTLDKP